MKRQQFSQPQKSQANLLRGELPLRHQTHVVPIFPRHASDREDLVSDG